MLQEKFTIPPVLKEYCMKSIGHKENSHRYRLTKKYRDPYEEERLKNVPPISLSETVWRKFVLSQATTEFLVSKMFTYYIIKFFRMSIGL